MKTIKVSEATSIQLDWLIAGLEGEAESAVTKGYVTGKGRPCGKYSPTTDWSQLGPIIEREDLDLISVGANHFRARKEGGNPTSGYGPTRLIVSKLGEAVEVPEELS